MVRGFHGAAVLTVVALSWVLLTGTLAHAQSDLTFDVIPAAWITANGESPGAASLNERTGAAFVFPSIVPGPPGPPMEPPCKVPATDECRYQQVAFFRDGNKFRSADTFTRDFVDLESPIGAHEVLNIAIDVRPDGATSRDVTFAVGTESLKRIQYLTWPQFRELQHDFERWLLRKGGCVFFGDRYKKFNEFHQTLLTYWRTVLSVSDFADFAGRALNQPIPFKIETNNLAMWATPLKVREELAITWGTVALYPDPAGTPSSVSRPAVGGHTSLQVRQADDGLALLPAGTSPFQSISLKATTGIDPDAKLPFPPEQAALLGTVFLPVYTPFDLQNGKLLTSSHRKAPPFLFLLSPVEYVSTDPQTASSGDASQFTTDGRKFNSAPKDEQHFARRYIIVGTASDKPSAVVAELKRLLDSAASGNAVSSAADTLMAVFANLTSLEVRRHVAVDGRVLDTTRPRLETWAGVIGTTMLPLYLESPNSSRPLLGIRRIVPADDGTPKVQLRFRFYLLDDRVLGSAVIGEGDQFDHVSKSLRK